MVTTQAGVGLESFDQDSETGRYSAAYDVSTVPPSLALAAAVAAAMEEDPGDMDPIYQHLDPDALDALVGDPTRATEPVTVSLFINQFEVAISSGGSISLDSRAGDDNDGGIAPESRA